LKAVVRQQLCTACGVWIPQGAARCPACNAEVDEEGERPWEHPEGPGRLDAEPHRARVIQTLGQVSMVCGFAAVCLGVFGVAVGFGLGVTAWVMANRDLAKMRAGLMDRRGEEDTRQGRKYGIAGTHLNAIGLIACGLFACGMLTNVIRFWPQ
jgi:hypothetical protein